MASSSGFFLNQQKNDQQGLSSSQFIDVIFQFLLGCQSMSIRSAGLIETGGLNKTRIQRWRRCRRKVPVTFVNRGLMATTVVRLY